MAIKSYFDDERFDKVYEQYRGRVPITELYKKIKEIDPKVPSIVSYRKYLSRKEGKEEMKMTARNVTTDIDLINKGLSKAWKLGNIVMEKTLQEIREKYKQGKKISLQDRNIIMKWYNDAVKNYISGETLKLRRKGDVRDQYKTALLLRAARYGKLKEEDVRDI